MKALLLIISLFLNLFTQVNKKEEYLIKINCKIIDHGYFTFIKMNQSKPEVRVTYSYSIDRKNEDVVVNLLSKKLVDGNYDINGFYTSDEWNNKQKNSYKEVYFTIIDQHFLALSNLEKYAVLDSLSKLGN